MDFCDSCDLLVFGRVISAQHLLRLAAMCLVRKACAYSQRGCDFRAYKGIGTRLILRFSWVWSMCRAESD